MKYIYLALIFSSALVFAQIPAYYSGIDFNQTGNDLKQDLESLITNTHTTTIEYSELWEILMVTDLNPENSENVFLFYGSNDNNSEDDDDLNRDKDFTCGNGNPCTDVTWNREHVFPRSLDNSPSDNEGPTADPHMLRACDVEMNGLRGNREFQDGSGVDAFTIGSGGFYPGDMWKGDVARIIMYMFVRYGNNWNPNLTAISGNSFHTDMPDIFLEWNAEDPVSEYEMQRNDHVFTQQGNRNPFIDNPYLATLIWGGPDADNTFLSTNEFQKNRIQLIVYPNPTSDFVFVKSSESPLYINIYGSSGALIRRVKGKDSSKIRLPKNSGIYNLEFHFKNQSITRKLIKQ